MAVLEKVKNAVRRRPERLTEEEYLAKLLEKGLKKDGTMDVDPTPEAPPIGYKKQPSMVEIVREMVRGERLRREAEEAGMETFEESEDFDVGDEPEVMHSPYENDFDPPLREIAKEVEVDRSKKKAAKEAAEKAGGSGGRPPEEGGGKPPEAS